MLRFLVHRLFIMIPTLLAISLIVFVIIQLPPGDFLTTQMADLQAQGMDANNAKFEFRRAQYGLDKPLWEQYFIWLFNLLQGDFGHSFEYDLPVTEVVGDRLFLSFLISFVTILFTWAMAFPIGVYSAVNQYSVGDHALTFIGFLGLATPNFLLALVLMYLAKVHFGTSIGGLMDPQYLDQPLSWDKFLSVLEHLWAPVVVIGTSLGGLMAMALSVAIPSALAGLVINDVGPDISADGQERILNYVGVDQRHATLEDAAAAMRQTYGRAFPDWTEADWMTNADGTYAYDAAAGNWRLDYDLALRDALAEQAKSSFRPDVWALFKGLRHIPAMLVHGALSDVLKVETVQRMQAAKPDLQLVTLDNRGHAPSLTEPGCLPHLLTFVESCDDPGNH